MTESLRPQKLEEYIGQEHIKDVLLVSLEAAKIREEPLDHVLLNGPPGLGKTTLANIIANELGWQIRTVTGPSLGNAMAVSSVLLTWKKQTIWFIDEVHRVRRLAQETLYPVLEDNELQTLVDSRLKLPPLTIIGATTNIGKLERPFVDRFGLQFQLRYYEMDDLLEILAISSKKLGAEINDESSRRIAARSRGTPRIANALLRRVLDYALVHGVAPTPEFIEYVLSDKLELDALGLRVLDIRYLEVLSRASSPIGVEVIASALNEEVETVEDFVEPYLMEIDLVERRRNGRWLTEKGQKYLVGSGRKQ